MTRKRAANEGTIFQRKSDGRWVGTLRHGTHPVTGKRIRETVYGGTQAEVRGLLESLKANRSQVRRSMLSNDTLSDDLTRWIDTFVRPNRAASTLSE